MQNKNLPKLNSQHIRQHFSTAAKSYDEAAILQKIIATNLDERLDLIKLKPKKILDLGAGTGILTQKIFKRYPKSKIFAIDLAFPMLQKTQQRMQTHRLPYVKNLISPSLQKTLGFIYQPIQLINANANAIPLSDNSVELIVSNLMLQWCDDLDIVFKECKRVLKKDGLMLFTTFGPDTLKELRQSWQTADPKAPINRHINSFIDMHDIGDALLRNGFAEPVVDVENFTLTYETPYKVLLDLKAIGATSAATNRATGLMGKKRFQNMLKIYENFRENGYIPASYEVIHGHAWINSTATNSQSTQNNYHEIPVNSIRKKQL